MDPKYNANNVEKNLNQKWIDQGFFSNFTTNQKSFSIILPPPNVTGKLHLGHAWDSYIQDTIIRYKKLNYYNVLFLPSMDHAGIATQAKVESKIFAKEKKLRHDFSRKEFLSKIWSWKEEYAQNIRKQWSNLGLGLNYQLERFTLDQSMIDFVEDVFIKMYHDNLIYRSEKAINWDPKQQTALSNIEVIYKETKSKMYYFAYDLENSNEKIIIATTRPETMFSDVAIAINPYNHQLVKKYKNKRAISPLTNKLLPIIFDETIEIEKGTGAMKVSAHAINDIEIIKKNNLKIIECIDKKGLMNHNASFCEKLDRFKAREKVVEFLKNQQKLVKEENITNKVGFSERSKEIIEILVSKQWFVKMDTLSKNVLDNLQTNDKVQFIPQRFEKNLQTWMSKVYDWTISRQIIWGHQIPAWYHDNEIKVQKKSPGENWKQDEDVLDTWFSSALAPFAFLINSEKNLDLTSSFFPNSLLVTGYDIIFFWVARMYFQSLYLKNQIPFKKVLIHGLIRDKNNQKMSKSLNNGIDPMDLIDKYGSDSLRWFLLTNSSPGNDLRFDESKLISSWKFCNKIWNIARYILKMESKPSEKNISIYDQWIDHKLKSLQEEINDKMNNYDFSLIGKKIYHFITNDFSSWYLEFLKIAPNQKLALKILANTLIIIHPFLPFISDYIFNLITNKELLNQNYPPFIKKETSQDFQKVESIIKIINLIRKYREDNQISKKHKIQCKINNISLISKNIIIKMANIEFVNNHDLLIKDGDIEIWIKISDQIKKQKQNELNKQINFLNFEIKRSKQILANQNFIQKAPSNLVANENNKLKENKISLQKLLKEIKNEN